MTFAHKTVTTDTSIRIIFGIASKHKIYNNFFKLSKLTENIVWTLMYMQCIQPKPQEMVRWSGDTGCSVDIIIQT